MIEPPIQHITQKIVEAFHPRRIVMFGSRARGQARPDSDLDLMIEMESDLPPEERFLAVFRLFALRRWALDVIVMTPEEVRDQRRYRNSVLRAIEAEGKVLYVQPG